MTAPLTSPKPRRPRPICSTNSIPARKARSTSSNCKGRLSRKEFAAADADKDGTLSKEEYLTVVAQRFKAADASHDGKLVNWEFQTPKGRALVRLLR